MELEEELVLLEATKKISNRDYVRGLDVDNEGLLAWSLKARHLISNVCGIESEYYQQFIASSQYTVYSSGYDVMLRLKAVFIATRQDFEKGYLNSFRSLIQADVFSNELDQARELLAGGYLSASAVIAGVVLETALRQLCTDNGLTLGSLNKMNADLTKAGVYNNLMQKRITTLADVRNSAAHGHTENFSKSDVEDMIKHVESFLADRL